MLLGDPLDPVEECPGLGLLYFKQNTLINYMSSYQKFYKDKESDTKSLETSGRGMEQIVFVHSVSEQAFNQSEQKRSSNRRFMSKQRTTSSRWKGAAVITNVSTGFHVSSMSECPTYNTGKHILITTTQWLFGLGWSENFKPLSQYLHNLKH